MNIVYKRLSEDDLSRIIKMRIDQLTEEYISAGRTVPKDVNLETALMDFYDLRANTRDFSHEIQPFLHIYFTNYYNIS